MKPKKLMMQLKKLKPIRNMKLESNFSHQIAKHIEDGMNNKIGVKCYSQLLNQLRDQLWDEFGNRPLEDLIYWNLLQPITFI